MQGKKTCYSGLVIPVPRVQPLNLLIILTMEMEKRFIPNIKKDSKENNMLVNTVTVDFQSWPTFVRIPTFQTAYQGSQ